MILEYIQAALSRAQYELIEDEEPYYGEIPELPGVWATGKTLEECRKNLAEVLDGWIVIHLKKGLPIPPIGEYSIEEITRMETGAPA
jgi:predicted RNase H-like HicB family nuclease